MKRTLWYPLWVIVAASCYGLGSTVLKLSYRHGFHTADLTSAQYTISLLLLWLMAGFTRGTKRISGNQWWVLAGIGIVGAGATICFYLSLNALPASLGIILLFQFTWMVMVLDAIVSKRFPDSQKWAGMALIVAGTLLAVGRTNFNWNSISVLPVLLGLLSGFGYALMLYLSEFVATDTSPVRRTAVMFTISGLVVLAFFHPTIADIRAVHRGLLLWGMLLSFGNQVIPSLLLLIAIPRTGGRMAAVLGAIELPVAVLGAHFVLRESVAVSQWIGVIAILGGIVVSEWINPTKVKPLSLNEL